MSDLNAMIHRYLRPPDHAFWNWSGDGEAIVWTDDNRTIAFRAELATILRRHVSKGLPRLGPILLLLAACRIQLRPKGKSSIADRLSQEFLLLDRMYELPTELRTDTAAKAELTAMILESDRNRTSVDLADAVVESLGSGFALEFVRQERRLPTTTGVLLFDFEPLREGLKRFDEDAFKLRLSTGIEQEILPAEIEEPLSVKVRKLLDRLQTDEEFAGLARLARNLMALVHLPKPLGQPDEIPVGGVSDIANRGSLDRLLLSELAQDDDLLMMRLAMNEAMFLRRETPPKDPPRMRFVIIDTTIRT